MRLNNPYNLKIAYDIIRQNPLLGRSEQFSAMRSDSVDLKREDKYCDFSSVCFTYITLLQ